MTDKPSPTAELFAKALDFSGKTQKEVARKAGLARANVISMMKTGETKIPIDRIPELAKACSIDPVIFMRTALEEYHPKVWRALARTLGEPLTRDEETVLRAYRTATVAETLDLSPSMEAALGKLFSELLDLKARKVGFPEHLSKASD